MRIAATVSKKYGSSVVVRSVEVTRVRSERLYPTTQKLLRMCAEAERKPRPRVTKAPRAKRGGRKS